MTAITFTGTNPTVGASTDTWGTTLNTGRTQIKADLDMLNATTANSILGRNEGTSGEVERLTVTETTAMLNAVVGATASTAGTKGLVPAGSAGDQHKVLTGGGTFQAGYGRAFGCVITSTSVNGSTPTIAATTNVASISNVTEGGGIASADLTFTNALPSTAYAVHATLKNNLTLDASYDLTATGTVRIYWGTVNPAVISVSGFA